LRRGETPTLGERLFAQSSHCSLGEKRPLCAPGFPQYTQGGIYHVPVTLPTHPGRHIPQDVPPTHTPREAYTTGVHPPTHTQGGIYHGCTSLYTPGRHIYPGIAQYIHQGSIYPGIAQYIHQGGIYPGYSPYYTPGRHIPGLNLLLYTREAIYPGLHPIIHQGGYIPGLYTRFTVGLASRLPKVLGPLRPSEPLTFLTFLTKVSEILRF